MAEHLTILDLWSSLAAVMASVLLALRANMLKPQFAAWSDARAPVWLSIHLVSVVLAGCAISLVRAGHATAREAIAYTAFAVCAGVLLWNLHRESAKARSQ